MRVWSSVLGGYPRGRYVRRLLRLEERGEEENVSPGIYRASAVVMGVQVACGMAYVVDGMLDWQDPLRPFVSSWRNVAVDGLLRYFDNNFFYRVPVFLGEPDRVRPVAAPRARLLAPLAEPAKLKVVVPGPVTFASLSRNESGLSFEELAEAIASILAEEARESVSSGAQLVQVDEPILSDREATRDQAGLAAELASRIRSSSGATTCLAVYFDAPNPDVYEELLGSKVDCISIDVADSPGRALDLIESKGFGGKVPLLGVIDARSIMDDDYGRVESLVSRARRHVDSEELGLTTSTWLDMVPYRYAIRKTKLLDLYTDRIASALGLERVS